MTSKINISVLKCAIVLWVCINGCRTIKHEEPVIISQQNSNEKIEIVPVKTVDPVVRKTLPELEQILIAAGLVKITDYDSTIKVDLKYASTDNFLNLNLYGDFRDGYLQEPVVKQLVKAQKYLKDSFPDYSLIVYDAVRPLSIQKMMWDSIKVPPDQRSKYLSNPAYCSLHNFGAAVDVSIVDQNGRELDMGTPFDFFEPKAYPALEKDFLQKGILTKQQVANRVLLRKVMEKALFFSIPTEWWHFNSCRNKEAKIYYPLIKYHTLKKHPKLHIDIVDKIDVHFKVQVKISSTPIDVNSGIFKGLSVSFYKQKGLYKYVSGDFHDIASAYELLDRVNKLGFSDAFVVAFNGDKRIEVQDAIQLMP